MQYINMLKSKKSKTAKLSFGCLIAYRVCALF